MKILYALTVSAVLLAGCGTGTPPPDPIPVPAPPVTPGPVVPPPVAPPSNGVPYYGEWEWTFTFDSGDTWRGYISISEATNAESIDGGFGAYQNCFGESVCDGAFVWGIGIIGTYELESPTLVVSLVETLTGVDDSETKMIGIDDDNTVSTDAQGRQVLSGDGFYYIVNNPYSGTFTATKISETPALPIDNAID